jgi:hypothetical protein
VEVRIEADGQQYQNVPRMLMPGKHDIIIDPIGQSSQPSKGVAVKPGSDS